VNFALVYRALAQQCCAGHSGEAVLIQCKGRQHAAQSRTGIGCIQDVYTEMIYTTTRLADCAAALHAAHWAHLLNRCHACPMQQQTSFAAAAAVIPLAALQLSGSGLQLCRSPWGTDRARLTPRCPSITARPDGVPACKHIPMHMCALLRHTRLMTSQSTVAG
jgi:hypothetical protein